MRELPGGAGGGVDFPSPLMRRAMLGAAYAADVTRLQGLQRQVTPPPPTILFDGAAFEWFVIRSVG